VSAQPPPVGDPHDIQFRVGPLVLDPHVLIYSTLMLLTAYALFDEGTELLVEGAWAGLIGITIAPLFALSMAHAFSDALDTQIRTGHRLTGAERRKIAADNLQYMYIGVPPTDPPPRHPHAARVGRQRCRRPHRGGGPAQPRVLGGLRRLPRRTQLGAGS
jgi:hypothetical protein